MKIRAMKLNLTFRLLLVLVLAVARVGAADDPDTHRNAPEVGLWRSAARGHEWQFPRDLYAQPEFKTEWWYLTGHLSPSDGRDPAELAFQLTFFRIGLEPARSDTTASAWRATDLIMAHAAVTDPDGGGHVFSEAIWRATPFLGGFGTPGDTTLAWCRAPAGTDDRWQLSYVDGSFRLQVRDDRTNLRYDLLCTPTGPVILHGDGGFSPKSADGAAASLYFSQPGLAVQGTLGRAGQSVRVQGTAWLDREIFTSTLAPGQQGWDWLALQLDDGRELMLYRLLTAAGEEDFALGTLVEADGRTRSLTAEDWNLEALEYWQSPQSQSRYPVAWRLQVPGANIELELRALLPDSENVSTRTGIHYWEGAVRALRPGTDVRVGRGFIEMTGYGEGSRPPV